MWRVMIMSPLTKHHSQYEPYPPYFICTCPNSHPNRHGKPTLSHWHCNSCIEIGIGIVMIHTPVVLWRAPQLFAQRLCETSGSFQEPAGWPALLPSIPAELHLPFSVSQIPALSYPLIHHTGISAHCGLPNTEKTRPVQALPHQHPTLNLELVVQP